MRDNVLFEINVYRCTKAKHKEQTLRVKNRYDKAKHKEQTLRVKNRYDKAEVNVEGILYETGEIYTYHYNELIGVLVLQPFCSQIRGYLYLEKAKRRRYGIRKKKFVPPMSKYMELSIFENWTSEQIYEELCEELQFICKDLKKEYNGAYVDLEAFVNIGQYIDWRRMLIDKNVITGKSKIDII